MRLIASLVLTCTALTLVACSDDDFGQERPSADLSARQFDLASTDLAVGGTPDLTKRDGAPIVTCLTAFNCNNACGGDQACGQACLDSITTPVGATLFMAVQKCFTLQAVGACAAMCVMPGVACGDCIYKACSAEIQLCTLDM